jgi:hypothetical protein
MEKNGLKNLSDIRIKDGWLCKQLIKKDFESAKQSIAQINWGRIAKIN